jgi:glucose/mannose-6-phosphate isomerase
MSMMDRVLETPGQLEWGAGIADPDLPSGRPVVLLGMGGSAMGAAVGALAATADSLVVVHRGYGFPGWAVAAGALVVGVSYSGNTEETLSGVEAARAAGLTVAAVTSGGRLAEMAEAHGEALIRVPSGIQPRAAVGYQASAVTRMLSGSGAVADATAALAEAAEVTAAQLGDGDGPGFALGSDIADALAGRIAIVYGAVGPGALAAYRWKTQINENAKSPAWWHEFPELNHNEMQGWEALPELTNRSVGVVYMRDRGDLPRVARRMDLTWESMTGKVGLAGEVESRGEGPLARFFAMSVVGDVASVHMAETAGIDPTPVDTIEAFKVRLAEG